MRRARVRFIIFAALSVSIALSGCAKHEIANIGSSAENIICFGDSLTFGYGATAGEDYPNFLSRMMDKPVINAGRDGDTSGEALGRLKAEVLDRNPLLVIVEFGGNDFLKKIPPEITQKNIQEIVSRIQGAGAMVAIVDISAGVLLKEYHQVFYKLALKNKAIFIPRILSGIVTNPRLKSDFIHPNGQGYRMIAQKIHATIMPYLKYNKSLKGPAE